MPKLPRLVELTRYDGHFFVDVLVPALRNAGFDEPVALVLTEPSLLVGRVDQAAVVVETTGAGLDALCAGKLTLDARLDGPARPPRGDSAIVVSGRASTLRHLLRASRPAPPARKGAVREVAAESTSLPRRKKHDRVRTAEGRYIKGSNKPPPVQGEPSTPAVAFAPAPMTGGTDRLSFALQNLARFLDAGLGRSQDAADDELLALIPGGIRRD